MAYQIDYQDRGHLGQTRVSARGPIEALESFKLLHPSARIVKCRALSK